MRASYTIFNLTKIVITGYQHRLGGFIAGATLWAYIIGGRKAQIFPIPECGMVAGMVITC